MTDALPDRVRRLIAHAERAGESATWLRETADLIVDAVLELDDWRAGNRDPRRMRTLELARRITRLRRLGCTIQQLQAQFGRSRSQIHRLLNVASHHATDSRESAAIQENTAP